MRRELRAKDTDLQKHLAAKDAELEKQAAQLQEQWKAKETEHEQKVAQVRKNAETEAERLQRRTEAEVADLKATISRLEVDLLKVSYYPLPRYLIIFPCQSLIFATQANKSKTQDIQSLRDQHEKATAEQTKRVKEAENRNHELETELEDAHKATDEMGAKAKKVRPATTTWEPGLANQYCRQKRRRLKPTRREKLRNRSLTIF